jgi:hypothetical protein
MARQRGGHQQGGPDFAAGRIDEQVDAVSDGQAEQVDELVGGGADLAGDLEAGDTVGFVE